MASSNFSDRDNWELAAIGLGYLKEGLSEFIDITLKQQHSDFLQSLCPQTGQCYQCRIDRLLPYHATSKNICRRRNCSCRDKKRTLCSNGQCSQIYDLIVSDHRKKDPNWSNTDPQKWFTSHISIGTCFINTSGYIHPRSVNDIDCSGLLSMLINDVYFERIVGPGFSLDDITKARDARHEIFHEPDRQLLAGKMQHYIQLFMNALTIPQIQTTPSARTALAKLTLIRDGQHPRSDGYEQTIRKIEEEALKEISEAQAVALESVEKRAEEKIDEKIRINEVRLGERTSFFNTLDKWKKGRKLRSDLICFYRKKYSTLSISPLMKGNNAPLLQFYATQTLYQVDSKMSNDLDISAKQENTAESCVVKKYDRKRKPISLNDVFFKTANYLNHEIYLTSDAGYGKTSFAKRLIMSWCQARDTIKHHRHFYNSNELTALDKFDFVFFIPLQEYRELEYDVDEMIFRQMDTCIRRSYSKSFIKYVLKNKKCLIILDGIDEWIPPSVRNFKHKFEIPHFKFRDKCCVLATSRLWKMSHIDIDSDYLHVELSGLKDKEAKKLVRNAVSFLNEKYGHQKNPESFYREIVRHSLHDIKRVPLLLMQTLCLWYDGKSLGESRCEIYFNMVELLLRQSRTEIDANTSPFRSDVETTSVVWFTENEFCRHYSAYLTALGKLAFCTLFGASQGSSLLFSQSVAQKYIEEEELQFGLNGGLLRQDKVRGKLSSHNYNISYIHKTYQELLSALYIASQISDPENVYEMITDYCSTIENALEVSNVFIFLCGLKPEMFEDVTSKFLQTAFHDEIQISKKALKDLYEYQTVVLKCYKETNAYNEKQFDFKLSNIILDENICQTDLKSLEKIEKSRVALLRLTAGKVCRSKEKIVKEVLQRSNNLQQLQLVVQNNQRSNHSWLEMLNDSLDNCKTLQLLHLCGISVSILDLTNCVELRKLHLANIQLYTLDISPCLKLQHLEIENIPLTHLVLPFSSLNELHLKKINISELDLTSCVNLQHVCIGKIKVSTLELRRCIKLETIQIEHIENLSKLILSLGEQLHRLHLQNMKISSIDLSWCVNLKQLKLQKFSTLSELNLNGCKALQQLHLKDIALLTVDLRHCQNLQQLHIQHLWRISELRLNLCLLLEHISLHGLEINELDLSYCLQLDTLQLREICVAQLDISRCIRLRQLLVEDLAITKLDLSFCKQLKQLDLRRFAVEKLGLSFCERLKDLHLQHLWRLSSIDLSSCTKLQHLHLQYLSKIKQLRLYSCKQLETLHIEDVSVSKLDLSSCEELKILRLRGLAISKLDLSPCVELQNLDLHRLELARLSLVPCERVYIQSLSRLSHLDMSSSENLRTLQLISLRKLSQLDLSPCKDVKQLHLEDLAVLELNLCQCNQLEYLCLQRLPISNLDLTSCELLQKLRLYSIKIANLDLSSCTKLTDIYFNELDIAQLDLSHCKQLVHLQLRDLKGMTQQLDLSNCAQLQVLRLEGVPIPRPDVSHCTLLDENTFDIGL